MKEIKCITFDKNAQDNLPQEIKDKMAADRRKAEKEQFENMITVEVEFHGGEKKKIQLDTGGKSYSDSDIYRTLNDNYRTKWKDYKLLS
jgi:hypothetical protein